MNGLPALLDTSVVIATAERASAFERPDRAAISVLTVGELRAGVLRARDTATRAERQRRLTHVRRLFVPLEVTEAIAERYGEALARARDEGRIVKASDLLIIATAAATGRRLYTLDRAQAGLAEALDVPVRRPL